ncbi:tryptophan-rich protein TspO-like [Athalia rosae]|uniref:tryptophan-rich protein TspO-like n=1 Tax=Athalia rosae TaxID=37344 RepID=UPI002033931C|nr:tryptophan-rich protein TspO-like [Athalia rosae]
MSQKRSDNVWIFLLAVVIPNAGGWVGSSLWQDKSWFEALEHPVWRPPNWLFPVVWTIMYTLMGVGSYYVWKHGEGLSKRWLPLAIYCVQLLVNWFWTPLFFIWQLILVALVWLVILWILVVITIIAFYRVKKSCAFFLFPYILWITIATALNTNYYILNPTA